MDGLIFDLTRLFIYDKIVVCERFGGDLCDRVGSVGFLKKQRTPVGAVGNAPI